MEHPAHHSNRPAALVTGAARRIGAAIARRLHGEGYDVVIHYRRSVDEARTLAAELETRRPGSVGLLEADLADPRAADALAGRAAAVFGRLDVVVNNASSFFPTPLGQATEAHWQALMGSNLQGPFFLVQAAAAELERTHGAVVNIVDIHGERPLRGHVVYSVAKAGLIALTRALAGELGPRVRVNAVAPGAILWPEPGDPGESEARVLADTALRRTGEPEDIAGAVLFLVRDAPFVTGQILRVDGGRDL